MEKYVDVVIPWVDGNDPVWKKEKEEYDLTAKSGEDNSENRYRDWDNLQYIFRGIEEFMPWVHKVYFITYGHLPKWLNKECPKLKIINHRDYIPKEYLPTFSSHTIELNIHRIKGLSDRFILFNDDTFVLRKLDIDYFFSNEGLPKDCAILKPLLSDHRYSTADIILTAIEVINDHFNLKTVMKENRNKWFNKVYGKYNLWNYIYSKYNQVIGFQGSHYPNAYLKKSFIEVWEAESALLDSTCMHKFRTFRDVNQHLIRFWQIMQGYFAPRKMKHTKYILVSEDNRELCHIIENQSYDMICINENASVNVRFEKAKDEIKRSFDKVFPEKSSFEL